MKIAPACRTGIQLFPITVILLLASARAGAGDEDATVWIAQERPSVPWKETQVALPAIPDDRTRMLEIEAGGQPHTLYIDPASISRGEDAVVRYTVVLISANDVWNIFHEGLHCGERKYRRYGYGLEGRWHALDAAWRPLRGYGSNRYRKVLYDDYMCNPAAPYNDVRQIIDRLRSSTYGYDE